MGAGTRRARIRHMIAGTAALAAMTAGVTVAGTAGAASASPATAPAGDRPVKVIVETSPGAAAPVAARVRRAGGTVEAVLSATDTVIASVPHGVAGTVRTWPGVAGVSADGSLALDAAAWKPDGDPFSMFKVDTISGAMAAFGRTDTNKQKITGKGVGVALIDSGVAPVTGPRRRRARSSTGPTCRSSRRRPNLAQPRHLRARHPHGRDHRRHATRTCGRPRERHRTSSASPRTPP